MKRKFPPIFLILAIALALNQPAKTQVLADTLAYSFHKNFAPVFKEKKVKIIYYTLRLPYLISATYELKAKKSSSTWGEDTILISHNYDTNGFYKIKTETLPYGRLNKKTEYFFSEAGILMKMLTTDSSRLSDFEFQEQLFSYENNRLTKIRKTTVRSADTTISVLTFHYSWGKMVQAIELSDKGKLLLSSLFTYDTKNNYIKEQNLEMRHNNVEVRTTYYYVFDDKNRISKVYGDYSNFKIKKKPVEEFSYDFVKEAYIFETPLKKIEWYK
jgi:hypothetical protein